MANSADWIPQIVLDAESFANGVHNLSALRSGAFFPDQPSLSGLRICALYGIFFSYPDGITFF